MKNFFFFHSHVNCLHDVLKFHLPSPYSRSHIHNRYCLSEITYKKGIKIFAYTFADGKVTCSWKYERKNPFSLFISIYISGVQTFFVSRHMNTQTSDLHDLFFEKIIFFPKTSLFWVIWKFLVKHLRVEEHTYVRTPLLYMIKTETSKNSNNERRKFLMKIL